MWGIILIKINLNKMEKVIKSTIFKSSDKKLMNKVN